MLIILCSNLIIALEKSINSIFCAKNDAQISGFALRKKASSLSSLFLQVRSSKRCVEFC